VTASDDPVLGVKFPWATRPGSVVEVRTVTKPVAGAVQIYLIVVEQFSG